MIPGFIISLLTFPGVVTHELSHVIACSIFNVKILKVKYFNFSFSLVGGEAGYVIHEPTRNYFATLIIGSAPFFLNSLLSILSALLSLATFSGSFMNYLLIWLSISFAMHSFPSNQDMSNVKSHGKSQGLIVSGISELLYYGMVILNFAKIFWLDILYALLILSLFGIV